MMALFRGGGVRLFVCYVLVPSSAAFRALPARRGGAPAMTLDLSSWSELESRLPSCASTEMPTFDADTVDPAALEGATVLYADRNRWCPDSERVWLALELKCALTCTRTRSRTLTLTLTLTRIPNLVQTLNQASPLRHRPRGRRLRRDPGRGGQPPARPVARRHEQRRLCHRSDPREDRGEPEPEP